MKPYQNNYLFIDTESGGLEKGLSLLTLHAAAYDENLKFLSDLKLAIRPKDSVYKVKASGLEVNHIDLVAHDAEAFDHYTAQLHFKNFLADYSYDGEKKLVPIGQFVSHDIALITEQLINPGDWYQYCTRAYICTKATAELYKLAGLLPRTVGNSLEDLCKHFGIKQQNAHDCQDDNENTKKVLQKFLTILK